MAVLVAEQRTEGQVLLVLVLAPAVVVGPAPRRPGLRPDRMRGRAEREDVQHHRLVVADPVVLDHAALGKPAHRDQRLVLLQPGPLDAAVQLVGQRADLLLARVLLVVVRLREQHAHHQQRRIHARQLDPALVTVAGLHVEEVVVEPVVSALPRRLRSLRQLLQELQRQQRAVHRLVAADPALLHADRIRGQRETDRSDAGERPRRIAVRRQAVALVGGVPEELERALLDVAEQRRQFGPRLLERLDLHRRRHFDGIGRGGRLGLAATGDDDHRRHQQRHHPFARKVIQHHHII